ncbi:Ig-like domain-containing protein [Paenibacillus sp. HJGM_3]
MFASFLQVVAPSVAHAAGSVYYVDSLGGDDANDGTSAGAPWKTLDKVNGTVFQPGDTLLFMAGGVWTGTLSPKGSGTAGNPIKIDMYGTGNKPLIAGAGATAAVYFYNQEQWEIRNLEITNDAATKGVRRGIHLDGSSGTWTNPKVYQHFVFENLDIHNVKGTTGTDYAHNGGIIVWGTSWDYHVSDVVINNCKIYSLDSVGIYLNGAQTKYSTGLKVTNNLIYDVAADGAFILNTTNGLIENNLVHDTHVRASGYHVPLWVFAAKDNVIQFNVVYNTAPGGDAMAYDADYNSEGTIIQYNYSHNNAGGGFLVTNDGTNAMNPNKPNFNRNATVRYNISQNDSGAVFTIGGTPDTTYIYNNTVYLPKSSNAKVVDFINWGGYAKNTYFYNNIFYNLGSGGYSFAGSTNNVFENNLFYGNHPASEPADPYKITADPQLASPGSGGIGKDTVIGYQLLNTSPAIGAGKLIANNGGKDYFGNPVPADIAPNIGAYQGQGLDPNNLPPLPQPPTEENLLKNPGFETGDFTNWPVHYNGATIESGNAKTGIFAAKLTGSTAGMEQVVTGLYPNTIYKIYGVGKSANGGDAVIGVKNYGGSAKDVHMTATSYTRKEITFTTGSSNTSATIYLYKAGGSGDVYFDDLELFQFSASPGGSEPPPVYTEGSDDEFDSATLNAQWHWIRENPANWSLSANPGNMRIVSENGDISGTSADAKNILLTGAPEGSWAIDTKLDGKPSSRWSQGGLVAYVNDDTYIRMTRLYGSGNQFQFDVKINGVRTHMEVPDTIESTVAYLRLVKYGNLYAGYYSADGIQYTQVGNTIAADLTDPKLGFIVCAGTGLTANFDYYHVTTDGITPPPPPPPPAPVPVSGVTLNPSALNMKLGETAVLTATVAPSNAANKAVTWSSDYPAIAAVDANGTVTAVGEGTATITVTTVDGAKTAVCTVQIVSGINLLKNPGFETGDFTGWPTHFTQSAIVNSNAHTGTYAARLSTQFGGIEQTVTGLTPNTTYTVSAWAKAANGGGAEFGVRNFGSYQRQVNVDSTEYTRKEYTFTTGSTNTSAVIFMYKRVAAGEVYFDDFELVQKLPTPVPATGVSLDKTDLSLNIGGTAALSAAIAPTNATNKKVTWSSDNAAVAKVDSNGKVTAAGVGTAKITVTTADGAKTAVCTVRVLPVLQQVLVSPASLVLKSGDTAALAIGGLMSDGSPADLSQLQIAYSSNNAQVAVWDDSGVVKAIGEGTATIKATVELRGISKTGSSTVIVDNTPPTTSFGADRGSRNGWFNSDVLVTLSATDNLSGIGRTEYRVDGQGDWIVYSAPFALTGEGTFNLQYRSIDRAGNTEELKQQSVRIDRTPPSFMLSANGSPLGNGGSFDVTVPLKFQASDARSGLAAASLTVTGATYRIDPQVSSAIDIDFAGMPGSHMATIFLEDQAGNTLETSLTFTVTTSIDTIRNLLIRYMDSGYTAGPLYNNLDQAQHQLDNGRKQQAAKHLQDFVKHLDNEAFGKNMGEREKKILQVNADLLIRMWLEP